MFVLIAFRSVKGGVWFFRSCYFVLVYELMFLASVCMLISCICEYVDFLIYEAKDQPSFIFSWCLIYKN